MRVIAIKMEMQGSIDTTRIVEAIGWNSTGAIRRMEEEEVTEIEFQVCASLQWRF